MLSYTLARWDGRPRSPPFHWSDEGGELGTPHDAWLDRLDLRQEGLAALHEPELAAQDPAAAEADLDRVKEVLVQHAGE